MVRTAMKLTAMVGGAIDRLAVAHRLGAVRVAVDGVLDEEPLGGLMVRDGGRVEASRPMNTRSASLGALTPPPRPVDSIISPSEVNVIAVGAPLKPAWRGRASRHFTPHPMLPNRKRPIKTVVSRVNERLRGFEPQC